MNNINSTIGYRIRTIRKLKNITQKKLGEEIGVSAQQIQKYEKGNDNISVIRLLQIASVLEISIYELLDKYVKNDQKDIIIKIKDENNAKYVSKFSKYLNKIESIPMKDKILQFIRTLAQS